MLIAVDAGKFGNIKTETWVRHEIRFVEKDGEWWAVAKDVADALGFPKAKDATKKLSENYKGVTKVPTLGGEQEMIVLNGMKTFILGGMTNV